MQIGQRVARRINWLVVVLAVGELIAALGFVTAGQDTATASSIRSATPMSVSTGPHALAIGEALYHSTQLPSGVVEEISGLVAANDRAGATAIARMVTTPQAVWMDGGTPGTVRRAVRRVTERAEAAHQLPVLVAYDIPGRDCDRYSAGGAVSETAYDRWAAAFASGLGDRPALVLVEPDSLINVPSDCALRPSQYPFTDAERYAEIGFAATAFEHDDAARVYLDGGHSAALPVGLMTSRLLKAGVQHTQGFFLNVANYQPTVEEDTYGTWIADCIDLTVTSGTGLTGRPERCESQYSPGQEISGRSWQRNFATWGPVTAWFQRRMAAAHLGVPPSHFVVDTGRNGQGPNDMAGYGEAPYDQPSAVLDVLRNGNWCNPSGAGLGLLPTTETGMPLVDAYLWVKAPGESDGQCDADAGVRSWQYLRYSQMGWPDSPAAQGLLDPLWGVVDPPSGDWFPQQALSLAVNADESPAAPQNR